MISTTSVSPLLLANAPAPASSPRRTVEELFDAYEQKVFARGNRLFGWLLGIQWVFAVGVAAIWSPRTWTGAESSVHPHLIAAVFLGGLLVAGPFCLMRWWPYHFATRHSVAIAQVSFSALLIHLTGGRLETHFHVFGSLAFLTLYRDWRVLQTAAVVVALDHLLRGIWYPESVYGTTIASIWRTLEHAGWVIFEDIVLIWVCLVSRREMWEICVRQEAHQQLLDRLEERVRERTQALEIEMDQRKRAAREVEGLHRKLVTASRQAGMAEVATGVLHNVGNVLNSVNVTVQDVLDRLRRSRVSHLHNVVEAFQRERPQLGTFLTEDPKGRQIPDFLTKLDSHLAVENQGLRTDVESLVRHVAHIREIITTQQQSAKLFGMTERVQMEELLEDSLKLIADSFEHHHIELVRERSDTPAVKADRHKVIQILVNLLKNAKDALRDAAVPAPRIVVRIEPSADGRAALSVIDNGPGIAAENLTRIFQHGFTTKADGHGFGLHSAVLAAREMGGDLTVHSEGPGRGARFTLLLPLHDIPGHER